MKFLLSLFVLLTLFIFSCQKELKEEFNPAPPAPPAPFQAKINGSLWVANKNYSANYIPAASGMPRLLNIIGISNDKKIVQITLVDSGVHQYTFLPVIGGVNIVSLIDSNLTNPLSFYSNQSFSAGAKNGSVNITSIDNTNKKITGTFSLNVYRASDGTERALTEGVFTNIPFTENSVSPVSTDTFNVKVDGNSLATDVISSSILSVPSSDVPFYIILGQSNTGWCPARDMTPQQAATYRVTIPNTEIWNPGFGSYSAVWQPLTVGTNTRCENYSDTTQFGPEASFFVNMQALQSRKRMLYKQGQGGTTLAKEWRPPAVGQPSSTGGVRWQQFDAWLRLAVTQASTQGYKLNLKGLIWMQGEDDSYLLPDANAYLVNLGYFFSVFDNMWQNYVTTYGFPFTGYKKIIGRIYAPTTYPFKDIVRQAEADFCSNPANNATLINTDSYPLQDWVHYSPTGQIQFGKDIFNATQFEDTSAYMTKTLSIKAVNSTENKNVSVSFPLNITPGNYTLNGPSSAYKGVYTVAAITYSSVSGTLQILENNTATKRIRGNFAFRGEQSPSGTAVQLSEGYFSVAY